MPDQRSEASTALQHAGDGAAMQAAPVRSEAETPVLLTVREMVSRAQAVQQLMSSLMQEDEHYGTIPGTNKPTLYKAGAEKLNTMFRLSPQYDIEREDFEASDELPAGHREYTVHCRLVHIPTGRLWGEGVGSCSTLESKYRYRRAQLTCPECGKEGTVIKGKKEYGGGWLCWNKKGGCGAKWEDGDESIEGQEQGRAENPDIADVYNTVLKMAKKRAHVDAVLTCTAASDIFTQDLEDFSPPAKHPRTKHPRRRGRRSAGGSVQRTSAKQQCPPIQDAEQESLRYEEVSSEDVPSEEVSSEDVPPQGFLRGEPNYQRLTRQIMRRLKKADLDAYAKTLARAAEYVSDWPAAARRRVMEKMSTHVDEALIAPMIAELERALETEHKDAREEAVDALVERWQPRLRPLPSPIQARAAKRYTALIEAREKRAREEVDEAADAMMNGETAIKPGKAPAS